MYILTNNVNPEHVVVLTDETIDGLYLQFMSYYLSGSGEYYTTKDLILFVGFMSSLKREYKKGIVNAVQLSKSHVQVCKVGEGVVV